jgi:hypothetical protein
MEKWQFGLTRQSSMDPCYKGTKMELYLIKLQTSSLPVLLFIRLSNSTIHKQTVV